MGEDEPERSWRLPTSAIRVDVSLFKIAADGDLDALARVMAPDATWGLPDRRRLEARPVFAGDGGRAFLETLRVVLGRFPEHPVRKIDTNFGMPGIAHAVRSGAEPMWSSYHSGLDEILIRKMGRQGRTWIDYVGLYPELPTRPMRVSVENYGMPPPLSPAWKMPDGIREPPNRPPRIDMTPE